MLDTGRLAADERRAYRIFLVSLLGALVVLFTGVFLGFTARNADFLREVVLERAQSLFHQIVMTRQWASEYGGVYVRKGPGVESNPWLEHPDLAAADGSLLTLRNPALITREISEIASRRDDYRFRITSLNPLNPGNEPDAFERKALRSFETGGLEYWETTDSPAGREFRYMGALKTERSCLACHAKQGYEEGDIRGGISVTFPVDRLEGELRKNVALVFGLEVLIAAGTLAAVLFFVIRLRRQLDRVRVDLEQAATRDALTGLYNRRYILERFAQEEAMCRRSGRPLACALVDADDFKSVNDRFGHAAGDAALRIIADRLKSGVREYDIPGRFGGEEFILLFPGIRAGEARIACDRIREAIEAAPRPPALETARITVSMGISDTVRTGFADPGRTSLDALLSRADEALYRAKAGGKNRCEACPAPDPGTPSPEAEA
jgi:diguanylate cyclase (GGDEF)-like protein